MGTQKVPDILQNVCGKSSCFKQCSDTRVGRIDEILLAIISGSPFLSDGAV